MVSGTEIDSNMCGQFTMPYIDPKSALTQCSKYENDFMPHYVDGVEADYGHNVAGEIIFHKCKVDFIRCVGYIPQYQVVDVHDPAHGNSGFYYCRVEQGILQLIECDHKSFGPIIVIFFGSFCCEI